MRKALLLGIAAAMVAVTAGPALADDKYTVYREITILHTNDIHSHLLGQGAEHDYNPKTTGDGTKGGIARLAALIAKERSDNGSARNSVMYLDSGDWVMGTVYEAIAPSVASELRLMHSMGCDATTFGNHEFDWGPGATALILGASQGESVPVIASNIVFDKKETGDDGLEALMAAGAIRPYMIKVLPNKLRVGLIGLMGRNAAFVVPQAAPVTFSDPIVAAKATVAVLKQQGVDVIIALSHGGVSPVAAASEDELLAKAVPEIDVVVSGHSHTVLNQPIVVTHAGTDRKTFVVQAGEYGKNLGVLNLRVYNTKAPEMERYRMLSVDDTVRGDDKVDGEVGVFTDIATLGLKPLSPTQIVGETSFNVTKASFAEFPLGNLLTDAMRASVSAVEVPAGKPPVDFAFETTTQIRDEILKGKTGIIQLSDAFRAMPLGIGPDRVPGWPLLSFYVTAQEVKQILEVTATVSSLAGEDFFLQVSGLRFTYDPKGAPFNRVMSVERGDELHGYAPFDTSAANTKLYKAVANLFLSSFIPRLPMLTGGALTVIPKDAAGVPITDLTKALVDRDPTTPTVEELKEWQALLGYIGAFPDANGNKIPDMPALYKAPLGRIRVAGSGTVTFDGGEEPVRRQ